MKNQLKTKDKIRINPRFRKANQSHQRNIKNKDITDQLSSEQLKELEMLANEDELKDTVSLYEIKKATDKWRLK